MKTVRNITEAMSEAFSRVEALFQRLGPRMPVCKTITAFSSCGVEVMVHVPQEVEDGEFIIATD